MFVDKHHLVRAGPAIALRRHALRRQRPGCMVGSLDLEALRMGGTLQSLIKLRLAALPERSPFRSGCERLDELSRQQDTHRGWGRADERHITRDQPGPRCVEDQ